MPEAGANYCTYVLKGICVGLAAGGIICSWITCTSCEFISFNDNDGGPPDDAEGPPFDRAVAANVGIFRYEITEIANGSGAGTSGCVSYDDKYAEQTVYPSLATAQFCALIAPIMAGLGLFANLFDLCACNFAGSYLISSILLLAASGVQAGTFALVADPVFCFEDEELECDQGRGVYMSATACILYFIASCMLCCAPRADPFCWGNFGIMEPDKKSKKQPARSNNNVVLQPIIIQAPAPTPPTSTNSNSNQTSSKNSNNPQKNSTKK